MIARPVNWIRFNIKSLAAICVFAALGLGWFNDRSALKSQLEYERSEREQIIWESKEAIATFAEVSQATSHLYQCEYHAEKNAPAKEVLPGLRQSMIHQLVRLAENQQAFNKIYVDAEIYEGPAAQHFARELLANMKCYSAEDFFAFAKTVITWERDEKQNVDRFPFLYDTSSNDHARLREFIENSLENSHAQEIASREGSEEERGGGGTNSAAADVINPDEPMQTPGEFVKAIKLALKKKDLNELNRLGIPMDLILNFLIADELQLEISKIKDWHNYPESRRYQGTKLEYSIRIAFRQGPKGWWNTSEAVGRAGNRLKIVRPY